MQALLILVGVMVLLAMFFGDVWSPLKHSPYGRTAKYWKIVSAMETAGWSSDLYLKSNNLFGMKMPQVRDTTASGETASGFARFDSPKDSVRDLVLYLKEFNYPTQFASLRQLVDFMGTKGYYGTESSDSYYNKCVAWADKLGLAV